MSTAEYPVWLAVLPDQRDAARADGGKHPDGRSAIAWDKDAQLWYARPGADLSRIQKWLPDRSIRSSGGGDPQTEFLEALNSAGLVLKGMPVMDGQRHRVATLEDKSGAKSGVYRGFLDGVKPGGWFINYHRAENEKDITRWKVSSDRGDADPLARVHIRAVMRQSQDDFAREQAALYAQQTAKAKALFDRLPPADPAHGYLARKGITVSDDIRQTRNGALVVPFRDADGAFRTLQYIPPDGEKFLFKDAPKAGHFRVEGGELHNGDPILYAEGYATARSLFMLTGRPVVMTIDAGNMVAVAGVLKARYPDSPHLFMADVDHAKEKNKGVLSANRAAAATAGAVLLPDLTAAEIERGFTDFNDLHQFRGAERLRTTLLPDIAQALEQLNHKDAPMATPDDAQPAPDNIPATSPDAAEATPARRPGAAKEKTDEILKLRDEGLKPSQIAEQLGIGQTSVYRILKAQQPEAAPATPSAPAAADVTASGVKDLPAASPATERETVTLYHGSPATFSAIDSEKLGAGQNFMGRAFYTDTSVSGVHYAMEEINHQNYHVYELEIPSASNILDRWDSSSLTDELRERIREAGKTLDQQLTEKGETSQLGIGDKLADCEKIDATFFMYASSPQGTSILKEAGIDALKDNSYIAIINTDLIDNVRLRSAGGVIRTEMTDYVDKALGDVAQDASRLSNILQEKPGFSVHYDAIRSEIEKLAETQNKPEEVERLKSLLTHTFVETIDSPPDRKTTITPLNRLYAEAISSLDLNHSKSAATLAHLIDNAVVNTNPSQTLAAEPDKPAQVVPEPVAVVQAMPEPEASQRDFAVAADATSAPEPVVAAPVPEPRVASVSDVSGVAPLSEPAAPEASSVPATPAVNPSVAAASVSAPADPYQHFTGLYGAGAELRDRLAALASGQISPAALLDDIRTLRSRVDGAATADVYTREHVREMQQVFDRVTQGGMAGADVTDTGAFSRLRGLLGRRDTWDSLHPTGGALDLNTVTERVGAQYAMLARGEVTRSQFDREVRMLYGEFSRADPASFATGQHDATRVMFERMSSLESPERAAQYAAGIAPSVAQLSPASATDPNASALYRIQTALRDEFVSMARGERQEPALMENVAGLKAQLDEAQAQGVYADSHVREIQGSFDRLTKDGLAVMPSPETPQPRGDYASRFPASASLDVSTVPARIEAQYDLLVRGDITRVEFQDNLVVLRNEVSRLAGTGQVSPADLATAEGAFTHLAAQPVSPAAVAPAPGKVSEPAVLPESSPLQPAVPSPLPAATIAPSAAVIPDPVTSVAEVSEPLTPVDSPVVSPAVVSTEPEPVHATAASAAVIPEPVTSVAEVSEPLAPVDSPVVSPAATSTEPEPVYEAAASAQDAPAADTTSASPFTAAPGEENAILVGAARMTPSDDNTPSADNTARIDADKLLSRVTHEKQADGKSVLYKLDGEPAFYDHGNRLVMAEGTSSQEEKVLAALLTASQYYHGRIELTGSDEFKAYAISVIVANNLDVSMKNASQQADLEAARRDAGHSVTASAPADAIRGDQDAPRAESAPPVSRDNAPVQKAGAPVHDNTSVTPSPKMDPAAVTSPAASKIQPAIHTPAEKAREPVTGKVTACGQAPFRFEPDASESTFITLRNKEGTQTFWGKELAGLLRETNLKPGRMVTLQWMGEQRVSIQVPQKDDNGVVTHYKSKDAHRNQWSLAPVGGARVQTGGDEMVSLSAFDVNRYKQVQHAVVSRLGLDMPPPPKPADGLYWVKPDGQGSVTSGDPLSAPRPAHNDRAGTPVMSSWGKDGSPDLYLVQGDGNYLQGVVRQDGAYQHVLVSLPDSKEAPPMVVNVLTPEGAQPIGSGNGINRSNGQAIPREHVVVRLTGDVEPRIAKLDVPAEIPPALHARLGYDERYKAETSWGKDQPAAAPQAAPVAPPRPAQ
ncbi:LPD7 domain-containing protein [Erwinia rhapontici]|uniref:LPD7 domain-containing protein n=1 Tax=Erwinia rhapontici TaxID=55212 RepID=UPI001E027623|nr:LPD7 domain-containing protein [Erwinia rhapontici]MBP2157404.1 phage/plasmid primase-like uncharacterized protein [Erwinia rhapontici]